MKILIVGAGEVGFHLAQRLSEENHDVTLVEADEARAEYAQQQLDVLAVVGNGASLAVLERAGIRGSDLVISVTSRDEVNLIASLAASRLDVRFTIARVSNPEYFESGSVLSREYLGIDLMINPERECAWETYQLLQSAAATDIAQFADGRVQLLGLRVKEAARVAGKTLAELGEELRDRRFITAAIIRDDETIVPRGDSRIEAGDQIYVLAPSESVRLIPRLAGYEGFTLRRVMIAGGSAEALYLARILEEHRVDCTILDADRGRCVELAERLPRALVLHADATDMELLELEGVAGIDGFVASTGNDETNMLAGMLAKTAGARKVVSLIEKFDYLPLVSRVGIDTAVSPRMSTVNAILRYVRRGRVVAVATLKGIDAEAIEFRAGADSRIAGTLLRELELPEGVLIGTIIRDGRVIIPGGEDEIRGGDEVIVFSLPAAIPRVEELFA